MEHMFDAYIKEIRSLLELAVPYPTEQEKSISKKCHT